MKSVEIGNFVTSIRDYAFAFCESLTNIEIPNSVTLIGERAFEYCTGLTNVGNEDLEITPELQKKIDAARKTADILFIFIRCTSLPDTVLDVKRCSLNNIIAKYEKLRQYTHNQNN